MAKVEELVDNETKEAIKELSNEAETFSKGNKFTWRVYDCDDALISDVIAISRLYFNNKCVDFIRWAVAQYKAKNNPDNIEEMFSVILLELEKMKLEHKKEEKEPFEKESKIKTFGSV